MSNDRHMASDYQGDIPPVSLVEAQNLARDFFGLDGIANVLTGERDRNFLLTTDTKEQYVLKVSHPSEELSVGEFQHNILLHLAKCDPSLPMPRGRIPGPVRWRREGYPDRTVRMYSWLPGRPLNGARRSLKQRIALGEFLGRLDMALEGFEHPGQHHELIWDLQRAGGLRNLLIYIEDGRTRALATRALDVFDADIHPQMQGLRHQVIHNDFNPHNVLACIDKDDEIAGAIDFGDAVYAPLVQDFATAAAYQLGSTGHPLEGVVELLDGYVRHLPLTTDEIALIPDLIAVRIVMSLTISAQLASLRPDNRAYLLRNQTHTLSGLQRLSEIKRSDAISFLEADRRGEPS